MTVGGWGGIDRYLPDLSCALRAANVAVDGIATQGLRFECENTAFIRTFASCNSPMSLRMWRAGRCGARLLKQQDVSLLAAHFAPYALPLLRHLRGRPLVVHFHGPWGSESLVEGASLLEVAAKRWIERRVYHRASHLIALSTAFATKLESQFRIPRERIRVVPGGVDIDRFAPTMSRAEARSRLNWPTDRPIIVTVRRLVTRMGLANFIDAVNIAKRDNPDLLVHICGSGKLRDILTAQINSMGLQHTVKLLGYIEEAKLPLAYRAADFSAVPSLKYEGFGLAAAESLASGTPVLVTRVDGLPEVIDDLSEALIVQPGSIVAMADRLSRILRGTEAIPSEAACRSHAVRRFAWPKIARKIIDVYREAMQEKPLSEAADAEPAEILEPADVN
jgi:glycogen(starch) synthase